MFACFLWRTYAACPARLQRVSEFQGCAEKRFVGVLFAYIVVTALLRRAYVFQAATCFAALPYFACRRRRTYVVFILYVFFSNMK